jgi:hypothetical protein
MLYELVSLRGGKEIFRSWETCSPKTTAWYVSTTYLKYRLFQSAQFFDELAAFHAAEKDSHQILHVRLVAEIVANNEELHVTGIRFRYWLPVNSSTIYRCRRSYSSLILGVVDVYISLPVLFVVLQQLYFRHHNTDAWFRTCPWIGSWTSIVGASLCQRASGWSWISKPYAG